MKIESVRGAVVTVELGNQMSRRVSVIRAMPTGTPGIFIPTTPDNIEAMRKKVLHAIDGMVDDWHPSRDGEIEGAVLTAIGITEEAQ